MSDKNHEAKLPVIGQCQQLAAGSLIVNDFDYLNERDDMFEEDWKAAEEGFFKGLKRSEGGILPEDNVRIYLPVDINAENIIRKLNRLYDQLGDVSEDNEWNYSIEVRKLIKFLTLYDSLLLEKKEIETIQTDGAVHAKLAFDTAKKMVKIMMRNQGCAELFPYEECEELADLFGFLFSW